MPPMPDLGLDFPQRLRATRIGLALAMLTIFFGFALGGVFGAFERPLRAALTASAQAVSDTVGTVPAKCRERQLCGPTPCLP